MTEALRQLPAVHTLKRHPSWRTLPDALRSLLAREVVATVRQHLLTNPQLDVASAVTAEVERAAVQACQPSLRRLINGTGVLLHTNIGRSPLPQVAVTALAEVARGYCNLEQSLSTGKRGSRQDHVRTLLRWLTGAEDALVVNNGAAAVLLAMQGLARGREVVVSRGELVEIGGGFRIPEVLAAAGCTLREIGTTNRTHVRDYERAAPEAACLLQVHRSNFAVVGFTATPSLADLVTVARKHKRPLVVDLGSGALAPLPDTVRGPEELPHRGEPTVPEVVAQGADLVCFSGDKLLGGPQAGILAGKSSLIRKLAAEPLARALRVDDLVLAALEAVLREHLLGRAPSTLPAWRAASLDTTEVASIAEQLLSNLNTALADVGWHLSLASTRTRLGGGVDPLLWLPSTALVLTRPGDGGARLAHRLRSAPVPVLGRVRGDGVLLDVRTLIAGEPDVTTLATELATTLRPA